MRAYPSFAGVMRTGQSFVGDAIGGVTVHWNEHEYVNLSQALTKTLELYEARFPEILDEPKAGEEGGQKV
jgi:hypothetical protein